MTTHFKMHSAVDVRALGPLELAYYGDAVFELYVRGYLIEQGGGRVQLLHKKAIGRVNAASQARFLHKLLPTLTEQEREVARRGRNAAPGSMPKNARAEEYHDATAFEALVGYLALTGQHARLDALLAHVLTEDGDD